MPETGNGPIRLLLVDGHSLAYRAFYALPVENFSTSTGQPTNAVYGFTSMLINAMRDERPTHLAVAFDAGRHTFRNDLFPAYKANRAASPEAFSGQVPLIRQVLDAMGIVSLERPGFEADDLIATLGSRAESVEEEADVLILTGDRDALQLVDARTTVLYPKRGVSEIDRLGPAEVEAKYGVPPGAYADFAAVRGDPSDNLPKIPGVGEKTAAKWIGEYGSLAGLLEHAHEVSGRVGEALRAHVDQVRTNRELTELVRDVPVEVDIEGLRLHPIDPDRIHEVFDALQFRTLRDRLLATVPSAGTGLSVASDRGHGPDPDGFAGDFSAAHEVVDEPGALTAWLAAHACPGADDGRASRTAMVVAGEWSRGHGTCRAVALAAADGSACWFAPAVLEEGDREAFGRWLADPRAGKALHGAKGPMLAFADQGWWLAGLVADTEIGVYLLTPGRRSPGLPSAVQAVLHKVLPDDEESTGQLELAVGVDAADGSAGAVSRGLLAAAARAVAELADETDARIADDRATALLHDIELPLVQVLARMERVGIALDLTHLRDLAGDYDRQISAAEAAARELVGRPFNLGSPKQLQEILFEERGLPKTKRIKTGYTTDADALAWLARTTDDPLPAVLLRWRDTTKLRQTVAGLVPPADDQGRIHTTFQQTTTATGRLSSTDPNLQNIPVRTEAGRRIRQGFVVGNGFEALLTADYGQIELRVMAHMAGDQGLIEAFLAGEDLHTTVAAQVFDLPPTRVGPEERRRIKAMSYGLAYGLSAYGLSQQLGVSTPEADALMSRYFDRFGAVRDYLDRLVDEARRTGYTETMFGRRRYLPDLNSDNRQRREMAERMALNAPIQGSAADIVKVAMLRVEASLREAEMDTRLLLQVHDELVCEVGVGERDRAVELVRNGMAGAVSLRVPLDVSVGIGPNWDAAAH